MIKYNLNCGECQHSFDSWFSSSSEFDRLKRKKLVLCSNCGSIKVNKSIMSPNVYSANETNKIGVKEIKSKDKIRKKMLEYQKFIKKNCKYVGEDFVYEARSIHYDKKKTKAIYGKATSEEIDELKEEGIQTITIPWIKETEN